MRAITPFDTSAVWNTNSSIIELAKIYTFHNDFIYINEIYIKEAQYKGYVRMHKAWQNNLIILINLHLDLQSKSINNFNK